MKKTILIAISLLAFASVSWGQIAAPRLVPTAGGATPNPAAQQFGEVSFIGVNIVQTTGEYTTANGTVLADGTGTGSDLVGRYTEEYFTVGFNYFEQQDSLTDKDGIAPLSEGTENTSQIDLALSYKAADAVAIGFLFANRKDDNKYTFVGENTSSAMQLAGVSVMFAEGAYFGMAMGNETEDYKNTGGNTYKEKRQVMRYGLAYNLVAGDGLGVHLEFNRESREPFLVPAGVNVYAKVNEVKNNGFALDIAFNGVVVGYDFHRYTILNTGSNSDKDKHHLTLGWIPAADMSVTVSRVYGDTTRYVGSTVIDILAFENRVLNITWIF